MPPTRQPHDPFTDAPLRPTTSNATSLQPAPSLRSQTSQHSLHSNTSAASNRSRHQQRGDLFAPSLSRRPTSRATPRVEDDVLADSDSERDFAAQRQRQLRRIRHGSPEGKYSRVTKATATKQEEEHDFVNRQPDGSCLLGVAGLGEAVAVPQMTVPRSEDEVEQADVDAHYTDISRQFFASGASFGGKNSKKHEEELEALRLPMMMRLREQVTQDLEEQEWRYDRSSRY